MTPHSGIYSWYETRQDIWDYIRLVHFPITPVQLAAYDRCLQQDVVNETFAALIDVDEFLVLKRHNNVVDFMNDHCSSNCGQLSINWKMMGTSSITKYSPVPVTKRNVHVESVWDTIKVIVRPGYVATDMRWRHSVILKKGDWVDTSGKVIRYDLTDWRRQSNKDGPVDVAVLHHYPFKSDEEFFYKTCVKGTSVHKRGEIPMCKNPKYYTLVNGTEFDDAAWKQLKRMVPKYAVFDEANNTYNTYFNVQ